MTVVGIQSRKDFSTQIAELRMKKKKEEEEDGSEVFS